MAQGHITVDVKNIGAVKARLAELEGALRECREAFEFTRQYVGYDTLPAINGWSWYDADQRAAKALDVAADG